MDPDALAPFGWAPAKDEEASLPLALLHTSPPFLEFYPSVRPRTDRAVSEPFLILSVRLAQPSLAIPSVEVIY